MTFSMGQDDCFWLYSREAGWLLGVGLADRAWLDGFGCSLSPLVSYVWILEDWTVGSGSLAGLAELSE